MMLVASMVVHNEMERYLVPCVEHLLTYCDLVVVVDDHSDDGGREWLREQDRVVVVPSEVRWREHEGRVRQQLLDTTLALHPTHVLSIDADELVPLGPQLRGELERRPTEPGPWLLDVREIWATNVWVPWRSEPYWLERMDGGWAPSACPLLWRPPEVVDENWRIRDRRLACGREPMAVSMAPHPVHTGFDLLHLGWADPAARQARAQRYHELDGGEFHASAHLDSITWPDEQVTLGRYGLPPGADLDWSAWMAPSQRH